MTDSTTTQPSISPNVYLDPSYPTAKRVSDLLSRLTLDEKTGQMCNPAQAIPHLDIPAHDFWSERGGLLGASTPVSMAFTITT